VAVSNVHTWRVLYALTARKLSNVGNSKGQYGRSEVTCRQRYKKEERITQFIAIILKNRCRSQSGSDSGNNAPGMISNEHVQFAKQAAQNHLNKVTGMDKAMQSMNLEKVGFFTILTIIFP
jgi:hypothetical protein